MRDKTVDQFTRIHEKD